MGGNDIKDEDLAACKVQWNKENLEKVRKSLKTYGKKKNS
jgi:hypothetical protein